MIRVCLKTSYPQFEADYMDLIRAFAPYVESDDSADELCLYGDEIHEGETCFTLKYRDFERKYYENPLKSEQFITEVKRKALWKRYSKIALYRFLVELTGVKLPYGSLTGIRPTKLYHDLSVHCNDVDSYFKDVLGVSAEKTETVKKICANQAPYYRVLSNEIDFFVNIPICVTRCSYCSFLSAQLSHVRKLVEPYCDALCDEIVQSVRLVSDMGRRVRGLYIGGGTPTSFTAEQLKRVLQACPRDFAEFTVEAGRPDTITKEKLQVMADYGVTRISINPQTFHAETLQKIGRNHSVEQIEEVFAIARQFPFQINMDLIAMLPDETPEMFAYSVDRAIALQPENITVHTLAIKRGSKLCENGYSRFEEHFPQQMIDYSAQALARAGYEPYYMYKQKYMSGNLENTGYCKPNTPCIYNIDIMEETADILANGAGGISKRIFAAEERIERLANPKGLDVYLDRKSAHADKKREFFLS